MGTSGTSDTINLGDTLISGVRLRDDGKAITFDFTPDMREISGFGGMVELGCRAMLKAGLRWLVEHPQANPKFRGFAEFAGEHYTEDNDDAVALSRAIMQACPGCRGMQFTIIYDCLWIRRAGWEAYVDVMSKPAVRIEGGKRIFPPAKTGR